MTGPRRWRSRPGPRRVFNEAARVGLLRAGLVHQAARAVAHAVRARLAGPAAFRASRLSLTLAGRNLWTITDYSGVDPEVNAFAQDNFATSDFESQPQVRYWTARLNVGF